MFANAYLKAGHQASVLAVAKPVAQGSTIEAGDLAIVRVASSGHLASVPAAEASLVVDRRAAVTLVPGTLLAMGDVSNSMRVPTGQAVVGVEVKPSQLPAEGVQSGNTVDVVLTGIPGSPAFAVPNASSSVDPAEAAASAGSSSGSPALPTLSGTVLAAGVLVTRVVAQATSSNGVTDVSLLVPVAEASVIATASAAGQVALVVVPGP